MVPRAGTFERASPFFINLIGFCITPHGAQHRWLSTSRSGKPAEHEVESLIAEVAGAAIEYPCAVLRLVKL
jgi:hypothetical protein